MASTSNHSRASVLHGPRDLRVETRNITPPAPGELQLALGVTTLCGSDLHYYAHYANGPIQVRHPLTLGHEACGTVVQIGDSLPNAGSGADVFSQFQVGDRVAIEPGVPCGVCARCREGRYNICKKMRFMSSAKSVPHAHGTLQTTLNHPARFCYRLPQSIDDEAAALLEPLSVAIHAVRRAGLPVLSSSPSSTIFSTSAPNSEAQPQDEQPSQPPTDNGTQPKKIIIFGAGAIGLLIAYVVRISCSIFDNAGGLRIVIVDVDAGRVDFALAGGWADAGHVVEVGSKTASPASSQASPTAAAEATETQAAQSLASSLLPLLSQTPSNHDEDNNTTTIAEDPLGADITFDCTGAPPCVRAAIHATRPGGKVVCVGMGTPVYSLPVSAAMLREVDLVGVFRYAEGVWEEARRVMVRNLEMVEEEQEIGSKGRGTPDLRTLVTHRFRGLGEVENAFEMAGRGRDEDGNLVIKVAVDLSGESG